MRGRKSQNQNPGIPIWGAATEQRQAPWSTGWLSCSGEKYIDTTFQNIAIHRGQQKNKERIEMSNKGSTFLKSGPCFKISTKMMISVIWSTTTSQQRRTPTTP